MARSGDILHPWFHPYLFPLQKIRSLQGIRTREQRNRRLIPEISRDLSIVRRTKVAAPEINLLDLIPVQNIQSIQNEEGFFVLLKPKFSHPLLIKHLLHRLKKPHYKISLDEVGSFIWKFCDGENTVKDIAEKLKENFGSRIDPLYERLSLFLQNLEKNKFIRFKNLQTFL
jgi:hypothetical protein